MPDAFVADDAADRDFGARRPPTAGGIRTGCALADTMVHGAEQMSASAETPSVLQHRTAVRLRALTGRTLRRVAHRL
ncbi:hypothetical protein CH272_26885 [Rhodococcus sp. 05-340-1]|nr:hypothetical protein CH271_12070 [Rhodococcus sp. 05-340-2]OZD70273.1 hypothetical protein CH272_26885 [Rhodococcus sp. 05-340-1]OZE93788.1 hypothetical protein CH302_21735 [Rhodococcus sp. 15-2388-1-1a]OZF40142.1 hypothetical protein CH295_00645 [Rhodococcus sp. 14-2483-1-2]